MEGINRMNADEGWFYALPRGAYTSVCCGFTSLAIRVYPVHPIHLRFKLEPGCLNESPTKSLFTMPSRAMERTLQQNPQDL